MEVITPEETLPSSPVKVEMTEVTDVKTTAVIFEISSNWTVVGGKTIRDTVTTVFHKDFSGSMALDDIADANTSLEMQPESEHEPCTVDIKLKNGQRIVRMGISSEASVLEIFKDSGEYATTIFSEFIDEFEGCTVYLGGVVFDKPTHEASIKFTRIKNERSSVYLYGIRLVLEDSKPSDNSPPEELDYNNIISDFLTLLHPRKNNSTDKISLNGVPKSLPIVLKDSGMAEYFHKFVDKTSVPPDEKKTQNDNESADTKVLGNNVSTKEGISDNNNDSPSGESPKNYSHNVNENSTNHDFSILEAIIDTKLQSMETRLMQRIEQVEKNTNKTLDEILKKLESLKN